MFWRPVSALVHPETGTFAGAGFVRFLLAAGRPLALRYAGDAMAPSLADGDEVIVFPGTSHLGPGGVVLVVVDHIPDVRRIAGRSADGWLVVADADPEPPVVVAESDVVGRVPAVAPASVSPRVRSWRRALVDLREAVLECAGDAEDPASTVLAKYTAQAPLYGAGASGASAESVGALVAGLPPGASVLVLGCGAGFECVTLVERGFRVTGLDFSPEMIAGARRRAADRGVDVEFDVADLRTWDPGRRTFDVVMFTPDVYSFIPGRWARAAALARMRTWLVPGGRLAVSARVRSGAWVKLLLTLSCLMGREMPGEWGDVHTRWPGTDGRLHRSYLHVFTEPMLRKELADAGARDVEKVCGWYVMRVPGGGEALPAGTTAPVSVG